MIERMLGQFAKLSRGQKSLAVFVLMFVLICLFAGTFVSISNAVVTARATETAVAVAAPTQEAARWQTASAQTDASWTASAEVYQASTATALAEAEAIAQAAAPLQTQTAVAAAPLQTQSLFNNACQTCHSERSEESLSVGCGLGQRARPAYAAKAPAGTKETDSSLRSE